MSLLKLINQYLRSLEKNRGHWGTRSGLERGYTMGIKCTWRWGQRSDVTEHNRVAIPHFKLTRESFQAFPYTERVEDTETLDTLT